MPAPTCTQIIAADGSLLEVVTRIKNHELQVELYDGKRGAPIMTGALPSKLHQLHEQDGPRKLSTEPYTHILLWEDCVPVRYVADNGRETSHALGNATRFSEDAAYRFAAKFSGLVVRTYAEERASPTKPKLPRVPSGARGLMTLLLLSSVALAAACGSAPTQPTSTIKAPPPPITPPKVLCDTCTPQVKP